jgi:hypothetical protein
MGSATLNAPPAPLRPKKVSSASLANQDVISATIKINRSVLDVVAVFMFMKAAVLLAVLKDTSSTKTRQHALLVLSMTLGLSTSPSLQLA